jgi:hypothetical protein
MLATLSSEYTRATRTNAPANERTTRHPSELHISLITKVHEGRCTPHAYTCTSSCTLATPLVLLTRTRTRTGGLTTTSSSSRAIHPRVGPLAEVAVRAMSRVVKIKKGSVFAPTSAPNPATDPADTTQSRSALIRNQTTMTNPRPSLLSRKGTSLCK